jgi:hypothetical protein
MTKFEFQHSDYQTDRAFVEIDNRFDVALIRTEAGLRIEVCPITDGEVWDDPFRRFEVDESEILALEEELRHG